MKKEIFDFGNRGKLEIDDNNQLYWNGELIKTSAEMKLQTRVNVFIGLGAISTAVMAFIEIIRILRFLN